MRSFVKHFSASAVLFTAMACANTNVPIGDLSELSQTFNQSHEELAALPYEPSALKEEDQTIVGGGDLTDNSSPTIKKGSYPIVDTGLESYFSYSMYPLGYVPEEGQSWYGQDAHYTGNQPTYTDNGDGTVTDLVTGLTWTQSMTETTFDNAADAAKKCRAGGYDDWRVPTIKELYSLIDFRGYTGHSESENIPYLDTDYFEQPYGKDGGRFIDAQTWSATKYVSKTMNGNDTVFGVNFIDGRIKGYPIYDPRTGQARNGLFRFVRGNEDYGINQFEVGEKGTVTDHATGLMWAQKDSGYFQAGPFGDGTMNWEQALEWAENLNYAGYDDWRLPNAKELQSIVDYTRSPATTQSPAINPVFDCTEILDEGGNRNYGFYHTSTTHQDSPAAVYIAFGEALGFMSFPFGGGVVLQDVHGAGAQRSDPKVGDPADYPQGRGPQGDVIRIYNLVRPVRDL